MSSTAGRTIIYLVVLLVGVVLGGALIGWILIRQERQYGLFRPFQPGVTSRLAGEGPIPTAVSQVGPAVVQIRTRSEQASGRYAQLPPLFRDLLAPPVEVEAEGSGIIINAQQGYVLTNAHMVKGARQILVTLSSGRNLPGHVLGADTVTDLAVVQIPGGRLPQARLGDSSAIPPGAWAIAIGNPYGFQNTVTVGVVSAKGRTLLSPTGFPLEQLLQTDAAINRGNSGGALVDLAGNVIGIPTAIIPFANGIGFAVPVNTAKRVVPQLVRYGKVIRPWLGIRYRQVSPEDASSLGLGRARGLLVAAVVRGSPADRAGLRPQDVLLEAEGKPLATADQLRQLILSRRVGSQLTLRLWRAGKASTLRVRLGEMPTELETK